MGKRKTVSADLHSELTEYSSLLRALRTSSTLDVVSHLTNITAPNPFRQSSSSPSLIHDKADGSPSSPGSKVADSEAEIPLSPGSVPTSSKTRERDTWTRWPLLIDDVHVPEFGLEDEISLIADLQHSVSDVDAPLETVSDSNPEASSVNQASPTSPFLPVVNHHLAHILALVAAHIPYSELSMQNRVSPVDWQSILDIVSVSKLVDTRIIENVRSRMEIVYPTSVHPQDEVSTYKIGRNTSRSASPSQQSAGGSLSPDHDYMRAKKYRLDKLRTSSALSFIELLRAPNPEACVPNQFRKPRSRSKSNITKPTNKNK